ncbi:MAG: hypothetical protein ACFFBD_23390 [Candidatus Hodarchaeota archaeon]
MLKRSEEYKITISKEKAIDFDGRWFKWQVLSRKEFILGRSDDENHYIISYQLSHNVYIFMGEIQERYGSAKQQHKIKSFINKIR